MKQKPIEDIKKQKVMDEIYRKEYMKQESVLNLKNLNLMLGIAENQIKTGELFNAKDTCELVALRRHQIKMQIHNQIFSMQNHTDFQISDIELISIKDEARNELRDGKKNIVFEMIDI